MDWDVDGSWLCDCCGLAMVCEGKPCPECGSADGWTPMSQTAEQPPCKCRHSRAYDCICPGQPPGMGCSGNGDCDARSRSTIN